jgi:hypothetical protein
VPVVYTCRNHRLNMEVDLQSLFGFRVTWCAQLYIGWDPATPPIPPRIWTRIWGALLVSKDRRSLCNLIEIFHLSGSNLHSCRQNLQKTCTSSNFYICK